MKKTRSITVMAMVLILIGAAMYGVAAHEKMAEEQLASEMETALQEDRESATLAQALFEESRYRARVEVRP